MTDDDLIRIGPDEKLVTVDDARKLLRDTFLNGDVFLCPSGREVNGETVWARVDPRDVSPA